MRCVPAEQARSRAAGARSGGSGSARSRRRVAFTFGGDENATRLICLSGDGSLLAAVACKRRAAQRERAFHLMAIRDA